jgi:hypothetical protein
MQGPQGLQFAEIMLVELGQVGLTVNVILLKDICRSMQSLRSRAAPVNQCLF